MRMAARRVRPVRRPAVGPVDRTAGHADQVMLPDPGFAAVAYREASRRPGAVIAAIAEQVGDLALIEPGQPVQGLKRRRVTSLPWPLLPVGEILERLRVIRPDPGPFLSGLWLAPAMRLPHRHSRIDSIRDLERDANLGPGTAFFPQFGGMKCLGLSHTAWLSTHNVFPRLPALGLSPGIYDPTGSYDSNPKPKAQEW